MRPHCTLGCHGCRSAWWVCISESFVCQSVYTGDRRRGALKTEDGSNTYDVDQLTEFEFDADSQHVGGVDDGPHELVVVGEEVIVEALGVGVAGGGGAEQAGGRQPPHERAHQLGGIVT